MENAGGKPNQSEKATATSRLLRAYREHGDIRARDRLVELYLPLVESFAHRYRRSEDYDDLFQAGSIGLINAIDRFDLERGGELAAFAVPNITGEIKRHLRDRTESVRVPRPLQELRTRVVRCEAELASRLHRRPTPAEVARELHVEEDDVAQALQLARSDSEHGARSVGETASDALVPSDERLMLASAFQVLDERERQIIYLRFVRDLSRTQVAKELGISERHLSRQTQLALAKLRQQLEHTNRLERPARRPPSKPRQAFPKFSKRDPRPQNRPAGTALERKPPGKVDLPYHISIVRDPSNVEGSGWSARVDELPGCEAHGSSLAEAVRAVTGAMDEWIADALANRREIPEPRSASGHSGRLLLRMPQSLHAELARAAEVREVSLNSFIASSLAGTVGLASPEEETQTSSRALVKRGSSRDSPMAELVGSSSSRARLVRLALVTNLVVLLVAGLVAVVLLIVAWQQGW